MESSRRFAGPRRGAIPWIPRRVRSLLAPLLALVALPCGLAELAAADTSSGTGILTRFSPDTAATLADSLVHEVGRVRGLEPFAPVVVEVADRASIRARLEEIVRDEKLEERAHRDEILMKYLGLLPRDLDLLELYKDLLEEQLAGMYDIDRRELVVADWLPAPLREMTVTHELVHALQDQHFSLHVRKKLGFDSPDAEGAWQALVEGDAMAVMVDMSLRPSGASFTSIADSLFRVVDPLGSSAAGAPVESERLLAAPRAVREAIAFPYLSGMRFVAALYERGGWGRVDQAYVHPPTSSEQVLHPERYLQTRDEPVRVEVADVRGFLGSGYRPHLSMQLGEFDLALYLGEYVDPSIAAVSVEGWGGCEVTLYGALGNEPDVLVLWSVWDTEDDALEFFGALLGVLEKRYPDQRGVPEETTSSQIRWNLDDDGRLQNVVRWNGRRVICLERVPAAGVGRLIHKLENQTRIDDPSPNVRRRSKDQLPWKRNGAAVADSGLTIRVVPPPGWSTEPKPRRSDVLLRARRAGAHLEVAVDRGAHDRMGISGYTHELAQQLRQAGSDVFINTDVEYKRDDGVTLYEHVFTQIENGRKVVHYIGVAELKPGFGYVRISEPQDGETPSAQADFYRILATLELVPDDVSVPGSGGSGGSSRLDGN